jgi:Protein of unknown function DUF86
MPYESEAIRRWLNDIRHHIALAEGFVAGMDYEAFKDDNLRIYAVTRCLEIVSEASRRLPDELKARHPSIEWREMAAAGNIGAACVANAYGEFAAVAHRDRSRVGGLGRRMKDGSTQCQRRDELLTEVAAATTCTAARFRRW